MLQKTPTDFGAALFGLDETHLSSLTLRERDPPHFLLHSETFHFSQYGRRHGKWAVKIMNSPCFFSFGVLFPSTRPNTTLLDALDFGRINTH